MLVMLLLLNVGEKVAVANAGLMFIIPEKVKVEERKNMEEEIIDTTSTEEENNLENFKIVRIFTSDGVIELKIEKKDKEEIWEEIKEIEGKSEK